MTPEIEKVVNSRMDIWKSQRMPSRFKPANTALANSSRLMRQFSAIMGILRRIVNHLRTQFPMGDTVASQLIRYDLPRLILMALDQTPEEALGALISLVFPGRKLFCIFDQRTSEALKCVISEASC